MKRKLVILLLILGLMLSFAGSVMAKESTSSPVVPDDPSKKSPQTSESDASLFLAGTLLFTATGCVFIQSSRRKEDNA